MENYVRCTNCGVKIDIKVVEEVVEDSVRSEAYYNDEYCFSTHFWCKQCDELVYVDFDKDTNEILHIY